MTQEQHWKLKAIAVQKGVSVAEIIQRSVDNVLASELLPDREEMKARARAVCGAYEDRQADVAGNHDRCLVEGYPP